MSVCPISSPDSPVVHRTWRTGQLTHPSMRPVAGQRLPPAVDAWVGQSLPAPPGCTCRQHTAPGVHGSKQRGQIILCLSGVRPVSLCGVRLKCLPRPDYCKIVDMAPSNNSSSIFFPGKQTQRVNKQLKYDIRIRNTKCVIRVRVCRGYRIEMKDRNSVVISANGN